MGIREDVLALADEMEGMDCNEGCRTCPADGTKDCRGDLSCEEAVARAAARRVREIIEHDACEVTTVSAYDLLGDDDREALAWVRDHGGLEAVKASIHQGAVEHGFLLKIAHTLGTSIYDGTDNADALLEKLCERLMPEGMEWPRFDDDAPIKFGDEFADGLGNTRKCQSVELLGGDDGVCDAAIRWGEHDCDFMLVCVWQGERVKRPAPKVLDADGEEIRVGDVLYSVETGDYVTVGSIEPGNPWFATTDGALQHCAKFTHRAPVLAADGKPLLEGEHVYHVETGAELVVKELPKPGEYQAVVVFALPTSPASHLTSFDPDRLTHERPDSWERLEEDMDLNPFDYCKKAGHHLDTCENAERYKSRDLVRRCRALAERGA